MPGSILLGNTLTSLFCLVKTLHLTSNSVYSSPQDGTCSSTYAKTLSMFSGEYLGSFCGLTSPKPNSFVSYKSHCLSPDGLAITRVNPFTLRAAKTGLTILEIFIQQDNFWKIFEGKMLLRSQTTTLLQISCDF